MKFKLSFHDRLIFLSLLPKEENFTTMRIIREASKTIGITEEEHKEYEVKQLDNGRISFDPIKAQEEKEFEIGEIILQLIRYNLEQLDKEKKLTQEHFPLYEKFVKDL